MISCREKSIPKQIDKTALEVIAITDDTLKVSKEEEWEIKTSDVVFTKSLNGGKEAITVKEGKLEMVSLPKTDYFNEPDETISYSSAPLLLTKIDNTKPFTFIAKVTPTFLDTYDAGALYIYYNANLWFKFAFERDERMKTRIVTVRTNETSDDNNHDIVESKSVYMKITSDVKMIGFYYSIDKIKWQLVRLFKNEYPSEIWTGISSQSPVGKGIKTVFEECSLDSLSIKNFRMGE